jgi:N-acetylglucosaminyl-diphospho-decaprenol L-rhamnosyltransferase
MPELPAASRRLGALFVLPTYSQGQVENARLTAKLAAEHGFDPLIVCNSARTAAALADYPFAFSAGSNTGYGGAANLIANALDFDTLVLCNDDLQFTSSGMEALYSAVEDVRSRRQATVMGFLPRNGPRVAALPGLFGVLEFVSGLSVLTRWCRQKLAHRLYNFNAPAAPDGPRVVPDGLGFPFVCVAITREAWDTLRGFDDRFPLYFEDMDLLSRAHRSKTAEVMLTLGDCIHLHSASARSEILHTLPLMTVGARNYLHLHRSLPRAVAAVLVTVGLVARAICWVPIRSSRWVELTAIGRALKAVWSGGFPPMPTWS